MQPYFLVIVGSHVCVCYAFYRVGTFTRANDNTSVCFANIPSLTQKRNFKRSCHAKFHKFTSVFADRNELFAVQFLNPLHGPARSFGAEKIIFSPTPPQLCLWCVIRSRSRCSRDTSFLCVCVAHRALVMTYFLKVQIPSVMRH